MKEQANSRRKFIIKGLGVFITFFGGTGLMVGCGSGGNQTKDKQGKESKVPRSCDDISHVSKEEIQKREKLSYVTETPVPGSDCNNCQFHIPGKYSEAIGGCLLFDGPVCPTGYCTQYVEKQS